MSTIKIKSGSGDDAWKSTGQEALNRLRIDKNLSDVESKDKARENLGLTGDVSTHHHDAHYMPLINSEIAARQNDTKTLTKKQQDESARLDKSIAAQKASSDAALSKETTARTTSDNEIRNWTQGLYDNVKDKLIPNEADLRAKADDALQKSLSNEITARGQGDSTLDAKIDSKTDALTDKLNALQSSVTNEQNTRSQQDTNLQNQLNALKQSAADSHAAEAQARQTKDNQVDASLKNKQDQINAIKRSMVTRDNGKASGMAFHWSQKSNPDYFWGASSSDPANMYLYSTSAITAHSSFSDVAAKVRHTQGNGETYPSLYIDGVAANDWFRIQTGGKDDLGWAEIATGDNGNEPIYFRQYDTSGKVVHSLTILDEGGNTVLPGSLTVGGDLHMSYGHSVHLGNSTWNISGDDAAFGDKDIAGNFCVKGLNGATGISLVHRNGDTGNRAQITYDGGNLIFNKTLQANLAGNASTSSTSVRLARNGDTRYPMTFYWNGQGGQPAWLWGGNDGTNMYVYNPRNFSVKYADSAGSAGTASRIDFNSPGNNYICSGGIDTGDAIASNGCNLKIASWWGIGFYDECGKKYSGTIDTRNGNLRMTGTITGSRIYNAVYNDYAEFFERGNEDVEAGDIVALDTSSEKEQYVRATEDSKVIVGVATDEFAHVIGGKADKMEDNYKDFIPVSLMGRVHVKVYGRVKPGDKITASNMPGIGRKAEDNEFSVGTALTSNENGLGKVRILVNR